MKCSLFILMLCVNFLAFGQQQKFSKEEEAVISVVRQFVKAAGDYDYDGMAKLFTKEANIGGASYRNGKWTTYSTTFEGFVEMLKADRDPKKYEEPLSNWVIQMSDNNLATVKVDALIIIDGKAIRQNDDYFTLIKLDDEWKILNGSYVSKPVE